MITDIIKCRAHLQGFIRTEFAIRGDEVEHVTLFTVPETGRTFAQNRTGPWKSRSIIQRDVTPSE